MASVELSPEAQSILEKSGQFTRTQEFLRSMAKRDSTRDNNYQVFEDYYSGENQRVKLTDRARRFLNVSGFQWCENFCEVVVDAMCERLIIEKISSENSTAQDWVDEVCKVNHFDELQSIVHVNTAIKGDGFVIVDLNGQTQQPTMHWNRPEIVKPVYDSEHPEAILFAAKVWKSALETPTNPSSLATLRMNLYFADKVEKWYNTAPDGGGDWAKHLDPNDDVWPIPWVDSLGEPLGVPVFHFRNKSKGRTYGISEIRGTIPQQDGLNKGILDLILVLDQNGAPQRWVTGLKQNEQARLESAPGTVWSSVNPDAKFGQYNPADPGGLLKGIEASLQRLAGRSRTPLFLLVLAGDAPSGESLKTAESGLVAKIKDRQVPIGNKWEDVFVMCAKLGQSQGALKGVDVTPDLFDVMWRDPESRNILEQRTALATEVTQLGLSKATALEQLGYDADEEAVKKDEETSRAVLAFDRGLPTAPVGVGAE